MLSRIIIKILIIRPNNNKSHRHYHRQFLFVVCKGTLFSLKLNTQFQSPDRGSSAQLGPIKFIPFMPPIGLDDEIEP